jgi:wyosine [tRNA(Phe)-imidazoG37] synthetase (radical SAM superfamily)
VRIERAASGYRVVGFGRLAGLDVWEPTFREAMAWREDGPVLGWSPLALPPAGGRPSRAPRTVVYGPVPSRRFGRSLGIDVLPSGCRVCSFDCAYCEYAHLPRARGRSGWPTADRVARDLALALDRCGALDSITFSGHGEPTLHPEFPAVCESAFATARERRPGVPVRILTNGSAAGRADVRAALQRLDERVLKLDADPARTNRPRSLAAIDAGMRALYDVTLQCCFVEGEAANTGRAAVAAWVERVAAARPLAVHLYTIDRPAPGARARPARVETLEEMACALRDRAGIEARIFA